MINIIITVLCIIGLKVGMDTLFLAKIDAFNRSNKLYYLGVTFTETAFGIFGLKTVLDLIGGNPFYIFVFASGAVLAGLISSKIKRKLDDKLEGQRKFFARITMGCIDEDDDLIEKLKEKNFDFIVETQQYISGKYKTVIMGSLENRQRMWELKNILRGRKDKHVVIIRAEDIYYMS